MAQRWWRSVASRADAAQRIAWLAELSAERRAFRKREGCGADIAILWQTCAAHTVRVRAVKSIEYRPPDVVPRGVRQVRRIAKLQGGRCYLCGQLMRTEPTREHVVPKARGGRNARNILAAHQACNLRKADRVPYPCELLYLAAVNARLAAGAALR